MSEGAYETAVAAANACADACDRCLSACLLEDDVAHLTRCIALDLECAAACRLLAGFAVRGSKFAPRFADPCLGVCSACAEECGKHAHEHCRRCAEACRAAVEALGRLASLGVSEPHPAEA